MKPLSATLTGGVTLPYLRVSSDKQDCKRQRAAIEKLRIEKGWIVEIFEDQDEDSEILLEHRPGGKALLERIRRGGVERIWVSEVDRLGRSMYVLSSACNDIEKNTPRPVIEEGMNCERYSFVEDPTKILMTAMKFGMASAEKMMIKKRTKEGSWVKAQDPYHWMGGPAPYGYIVEGFQKTAHLVKSVKSTTGNTRFKSQVAVVYRIDTMAADGKSCRDISDFLNHLGIPPQQRKNRPATRWTPGRIRNIIINPIYKGVHYYGRLEIYRNPDDPRRTPHTRSGDKRSRPSLERLVPELAIVPEKLWDKANYEIKLKFSASKSHVQHQYLLTGLIRCELCGRTYTASTAHGKDIWYRCPGRSGAAYGPKGERCNAPALKGETLEAAVWDEVYKLILKPGPALKRLEEQNIAREGANHSVADEIRERESDRIKAIGRRMEIARQQGRNPQPDAEYDELMREANADVEYIDKDLERLRILDQDTKTHEAAKETALGGLVALREKLLAGKLTFEERRDAVKHLVTMSVGANRAVTLNCSFASHAERFAERLPNDGPLSRWWSRRI